jgi:anti-sigma factor RsiW
MTDEELISEYLDGRLAAPDAAALERRLAAEPGLAARLRVLRAVKAGLKSAAVPAPAALRARLKAAARSAAPEPAWRMILREAFAPRPGSFAAATAFAAAVVLIAVRGEKPPRPVLPPILPVVSPEAGPAPAQAALAVELWSDDEGGDDDAL